MPIVKTSKGTFSCPAGQNLLQALTQNGVWVDSPCGGNGTCGKCKVTISEKGTAREVLACRYLVEQDLTVTLPDIRNADISISGKQRNFRLDPVVNVCKNEKNITSFQYQNQILHTGTGKNLGIAVDIGTTTIAMYLCDLEHGKILETRSCLNAQKNHGGDVISRIHFCMEDPQGLSILQAQITGQLSEMAASFSGLDPQDIQIIIAAGNTTMLHLLLGEDPAGISKAPFTPKFTEAKETNAWDLGIRINRHCLLVTLPCISAYVGADIVAGILSSGMDKTSASLLVDIGTNGEMALFHQGILSTCATAAGPAFEGYNMSCGIGGVEGAISKVHQDGGFETIGSLPACGICGSGLIDAAAMLLQQGIIEDTGYMESDYHFTPDVFITPKDIRQLQLAKAAIAAGIQTLCQSAGCLLDQVDHIYLAGGFGTFLNPDSAVRIGLLSQAFTGKIEAIGNASGMGCILSLFSKEAKAHTDQIKDCAQYLELSGSEDFQNFYMDEICFPENDW